MSTSVYKSLKTYATEGQLIELSIKTSDDNNELCMGKILEILTGALIIESNNEIRSIPSKNILSWKLHKTDNHDFPIIKTKYENNTTTFNKKSESDKEIDQPLNLIDIKGEKPLKFNSLQDLSQIVLPKIEAENQLVVPAIGEIITVISNRYFGFIKDMMDNQVYFNFNNIVNKELLNELQDFSKIKASIPVIYTKAIDFYGKKAFCIQKPAKVETLLNSAKIMMAKDTKTALHIVEQILTAFPDNYSADQLRIEIISRLPKNHKAKNSKKLAKAEYAFTYYQKANRAKNIQKDLNSALNYYQLALNNNEKRESCIKDIGMLFISMQENENAINFIKKHEKELPKNITNYNYLMNFYYTVKEYAKVIEYIDLLLQQNLVTNHKRNHSQYLSKKGFSLIQLGEISEAKEALKLAVTIQIDNSFARRLLDALDEPDEIELDKIIEEAEEELRLLGGEVSLFLKERLRLCEFDGLKSSAKSNIVETGDIKRHYLDDIRETLRTKEVFAGKAKERASYLLTEARLMEELEPERDNEYRSVLAKYCNAMAFIAITEKYEDSLDLARFFYLEAFNLEDKWMNLSRQVVLFLRSINGKKKQIISDSATPNEDIPELLDSILSLLFKEKEVADVIWNNLLSMFISNKTITAQLIKKIYDNKEYRFKSIAFLQSLDINIETSKITFSNHTDAWNKAREKRNNEYKNWLASIKAIYTSNNFETLVNQLVDALNEVKKKWLTPLDISRINIIIDDIYDTLNQYLRQSGFKDKERYYSYSKTMVTQLITEIKEKPTKFSYEGFIPLLENINILLDKSFNTVQDASTPKVTISILGEANVVEKDNSVEFQIAIENSKDSSPIRDILVKVQNDNDINFIKRNNEHFNSVDGGEKCILRIKIIVSEKVKHDKATKLNIECEYKTRSHGDPVYQKEQLSLRLYSENEFENIENPYTPIADGGPVEDKKMFYGRDEFIKSRVTALLNAESKQIIIYGQKRSGKSSVLLHLKKNLEDTNQAFCISFSLGLIVKDLNEFTFYHKILSTIERELKLKEAKKETVPQFICPSLDKFMSMYGSNPANGFIELIEDFKLSCAVLGEWENKKLIIMIDEFTYLYTAIRVGTTSNTIMKQWKAITQSENVKLSVVLVGQDVVPSFKKEDYAQNAFGIIEDIRLTYLEDADARRLIEEPILDNEGTSRFIGNAVDTIMEYTSRNPYYINIFCARLVDYMNAKKIMKVTEADIKEVAFSFIEGNQALGAEKFDNLIRAGETHDLREFEDEPIIKVLRQIAIGSKNIGVCPRDNISLTDKELEDRIISHLIDREVLERKQGDNYKIQVRLFQEWLLKN